jgi:hypothetical protein
MHPLLRLLLLLLFILSFAYVWRAPSLFKKDFVVVINGYRISPWICSVVFCFWVLGMAMSFYALSLLPRLIKILLASA